MPGKMLEMSFYLKIDRLICENYTMLTNLASPVKFVNAIKHSAHDLLWFNIFTDMHLQAFETGLVYRRFQHLA